MQVQTNSPLMTRYDKDPGRWRPFKYGCVVDVPVLETEAGENTILIMNQPFMMDRISFSVVGNTHDYQGTGLADDGQYFVEWREEQSVYQNAPILAKTAFGTEEFPLYLSAPVAFAGNKTLYFRLSSSYTRVLNPVAEYFKVQVVCHGISDWGTL